MRLQGHFRHNQFNQIFMKKTVSSLYEVPEIQVLRISAQDVLCASTLSGGGSNESVVDDGTKFSSWDWTY